MSAAGEFGYTPTTIGANDRFAGAPRPALVRAGVSESDATDMGAPGYRPVIEGRFAAA